MSLIKRRKSPGWGKIPLKQDVSRVKRVPKTVNRKVVKIMNPISGKKINLNGPTHKRLIREKVLNEKGELILVEVLVGVPGGKEVLVGVSGPVLVVKEVSGPVPSEKQVPSGKQVSDDVVSTLMQFLPSKSVVEISKLQSRYPDRALLYGKFNLKNEKVCHSFSNKDFTILERNKFLDQYDLLLCAVKRRFHNVARRIYDKININRNVYDLFLNVCYYGPYDLFKKLLSHKKLKKGDTPSRIPFNWVIDGYYEYKNQDYLKMIKDLLKSKEFDNPNFNDYYGLIASSIQDFASEVLKILLQDPRSDPNQTLKYAIEHNNIDALKVMLGSGRIDYDSGEIWGAFGSAIATGKVNMAKEFSKRDEFDPSKWEDMSPLFYSIVKAAKGGFLEAVVFAIELQGYAKGSSASDPVYIVNHFLTPAIKSGNLELVKVLVEDFDADPSNGNILNPPVIVAIESGFLDIVKFLFKFKKVRERLSTQQLKMVNEKLKGDK